jgi:hypothetical protein
VIGAALLHLMVAVRLATAIAVAHPEIAPDRVTSASLAIAVERAGYEPELLASILAGESRFDFRSVDRRSGACGLGSALYSRNRQIQARRCRAVTASARAGVRAAVAKLDAARAFAAGRPAERRHGWLVATLAGYQAGPAGVRALERGSRRRLAAARVVIAERDRLRALVGGRPGAAVAIGASS